MHPLNLFGFNQNFTAWEIPCAAIKLVSELAELREKFVVGSLGGARTLSVAVYLSDSFDCEASNFSPSYLVSVIFLCFMLFFAFYGSQRNKTRSKFPFHRRPQTKLESAR